MAYSFILQCAIPLGVCSVAPAREQGQPFAFTISSEEIEVFIHSTFNHCHSGRIQQMTN